VLVKRSRVVAEDVDLAHQVELHAVLAIAELGDLLLVAGFLLAEVVAGDADDGEAFQAMRDGDSVELSIGGETILLPIRLRPSLPKGTIGLPVGLAGQAWRDLPAMATIRKVATA